MMIKVSPFATDDYRQFLRAILDANPGRRGMRSELARAAKCSPSFLTQVLAGEASMSFDHIVGIANHLEASDAEIGYLRELVIREKCATKAAREDSERRAQELRRQVGDGIMVGVPPAPVNARKLTEAMTSLAHWDVFGLLGAPGDSTPDRLAARLRRTPATIRKVLEDLSAAGVVELVGNDEWRCRGGFFKQSRGMAIMGGVLQKLRLMVKVLDGEVDVPRYATLRLKASDIPELQKRASELFEFAWTRSSEREETGDTLVFLSVEIDRIC